MKFEQTITKTNGQNVNNKIYRISEKPQTH